jgi:hypothetical protein
MKINCGPTWGERRRAKEEWHRWFAWHPVRVASRHCLWLEFIERKGTYEGFIGDYANPWSFEYRPLSNER